MRKTDRLKLLLWLDIAEEIKRIAVRMYAWLTLVISFVKHEAKMKQNDLNW